MLAYNHGWFPKSVPKGFVYWPANVGMRNKVSYNGNIWR